MSGQLDISIKRQQKLNWVVMGPLIESHKIKTPYLGEHFTKVWKVPPKPKLACVPCYIFFFSSSESLPTLLVLLVHQLSTNKRWWKLVFKSVPRNNRMCYIRPQAEFLIQESRLQNCLRQRKIRETLNKNEDEHAEFEISARSLVGCYYLQINIRLQWLLPSECPQLGNPWRYDPSAGNDNKSWFYYLQTQARMPCSHCTGRDTREPIKSETLTRNMLKRCHW